jgi:hypothetical protein
MQIGRRCRCSRFKNTHFFVSSKQEKALAHSSVDFLFIPQQNSFDRNRAKQALISFCHAER